MKTDFNILNVSILGKTGKKPLYSYKIWIDLEIKTTKGFFTKNEVKTVKACQAEIKVCRYVNLSMKIPHKDLTIEERQFIESQEEEIFKMMKKDRDKIKSEDDCCLNPDLEVAYSYKHGDIILGYLMNNEKFEVLNYLFESNIEGITFKNKEIDTIFNWYEHNPRRNRIKEYACLNCKTCITEDEESRIKTFEDWMKHEVKIKLRKDEAKSICFECH